jgi:nitric oxide reductase activation protein
MSESINLAMPFIRRQLTNVYEAKTTKDVSRICLELVDVFDDIVEKDMLNTYFFLAELQYDQLEEGLTFEDLKRKDSLVNDDILEHEKDGDEDIHEEKMEMWHRETSEATQSFLQFDMDQGSKTDMLGDGVREGDDGDQAMGMV